MSQTPSTKRKIFLSGRVDLTQTSPKGYCNYYTQYFSVYIPFCATVCCAYGTVRRHICRSQATGSIPPAFVIIILIFNVSLVTKIEQKK